MKIWITGGSGFIGRNLKEQLASKYEICAPLSSEVDLLDEHQVYEYIKNNSFDAVIHAATWNATKNSTKDLTKVFEHNLRMFYNIARCSDFFGKMIYYGSGAEYDRRHWVPKMREDYFDTYVPVDQYGFSKYIMRKYTDKAKNIYNLCLFGVFGKYEDWQIRFISNACCKAVFDLPITIKQNVFFDYMYINDLVKITEWFVNNNCKDRIYNVCTGETIDLLTLAKRILEVANKKLDIKIAKEGVGTVYSGDNTKLLGEMVNYQFKEMSNCLDEVFHWYWDNRSYINKENLLVDK